MMILDSVQRQIAIAAARHFERQAAGAARPDLESRKAHWREVAELGWIAAAVPEALGGLGGDIEMAVLCREFATALSDLPYLEAGVLPANFLTAASALDARFGGVADAVMAGEAIVVAAVHDADLRIDAAGGVGGRVTGVFGAELADYFLLRAGDGNGGERVLFVPATMAGLRIAHLPTIDGRRAGVLEFDGAALPAEAIETGDAAVIAALDRARDRAVLGLSVELLALSERMLDMTCEYLQLREQFGQKLAGFQALRHRVADMFAECELGRALVASTLGRDGGDCDDDAAARARAVSACKLKLGQIARTVGAQAIQLHGAMAMTEEYALGRIYKRALCARKSLGDEDFHAERMSSLPREWL